MAEGEIDQLTRELIALRLRESNVLQRLSVLETRRSGDRQRNRAAAQPPPPPTAPVEPPDPTDTVDGFSAGDTVRFRGTRVTRAGIGTILGFTAGTEPFARIRHSGPPGNTVKRKPAYLQHA